MVQDIVGLPEKAELKVEDWYLKIENHQVVTKTGGLLLWMLHTIRNDHWNEAVRKMKKAAISYEAVIEQCCAEMENEENIAWLIGFYSDFYLDGKDRTEFINSPAGMQITRDVIDKIRDCEDWSEFCDVMQWGDNFQQEIGRRSLEQIRCRK